jgi:hypothetical protein
MDFEHMLRMALAPVDPPDSLKARVETTLQELTDAAVDELEGWELSAMRDPRNWVRPVAAIAVGTAAGAGLIVLGWRRQHRRQRSVRVAAGEVRRLVKR